MMVPGPNTCQIDVKRRFELLGNFKKWRQRVRYRIGSDRHTFELLVHAWVKSVQDHIPPAERFWSGSAQLSVVRGYKRPPRSRTSRGGGRSSNDAYGMAGEVSNMDWTGMAGEVGNMDWTGPAASSTTKPKMPKRTRRGGGATNGAHRVMMRFAPTRPVGRGAV